MMGPGIPTKISGHEVIKDRYQILSLNPSLSCEQALFIHSKSKTDDNFFGFPSPQISLQSTHQFLQPLN
jgi:hypothetical protein